jgi:UDP:flavonoid glycosyltransferase YjiC (YdhE family)
MKFLFCCLASAGYVNPCIGLALKLQERGHETAFVTGEGHEELLASHGLVRIPRGEPDGPSFEVPQWFYASSVAMQMKHINYALRHFPADVLVGQQLTLGPLLMGEIRRLPVALLGLFVYLWPPSDPQPDQTLTKREEVQAWRHQDMLKWYNQSRTALGMPPVSAGPGHTPLLGDLFMLRSIPAIHEDLAAFSKKVHLVGNCLWEDAHSDPELDAWLDAAVKDGSPIVYVQHGRTFDRPGFWENLVAELAGTDVRVAASSSRMDCSIGDLPANFFVRPFIPQGRVLRHANALVSTSNTTAVLGALAAGVPSLLIPAGGEEPDVAELCERLGVAKVLTPELASVALLASELRSVFENQEMKNTAQHIARQFAGFDSFSVGADLLESLAQIKSPVLRSEMNYTLHGAV